MQATSYTVNLASVPPGECASRALHAAFVYEDMKTMADDLMQPRFVTAKTPHGGKARRIKMFVWAIRRN